MGTTNTTYTTSSIVGAEDLVYAKLITDEKTAKPTYGEVKPFCPFQNIKVDTSVDIATQWADNGAHAVQQKTGDTKVTMGTTAIPQDVIADILGLELKKGVIAYKADAISPYVAIGFRGKKENGNERLVWLTKGKFTVPSDEWKTGNDKAEFQEVDIEGTFVNRKHDKVFKIVGDTDDAEFASQYAPTFFDQVFDVEKLDEITTP
ncbi:major tail protein [Bacillus subtilis]|uniref:major tail protein n=1 Tax=Bacillus subtilis TaxID=1423 RepID=UPI0022F38812|nr:major tail protein [Bacillus subtilis]WBY39816.1 hypothetical protein PF977_10920 [Bacillus subtilis]